MSRATLCGSDSASTWFITGPAGTPTASSFPHQWAVVSRLKYGVSASTSAATFLTRSGLVAKRGSPVRCGQPRTSQVSFQKWSFAQPMVM